MSSGTLPGFFFRISTAEGGSDAGCVLPCFPGELIRTAPGLSHPAFAACTCLPAKHPAGGWGDRGIRNVAAGVALWGLEGARSR
ncbi:hypothetical protein V2G26_009116 [Clonostachys chloroleuca]